MEELLNSWVSTLNGYLFASYFKKNGDSVDGWLKLSDLKNASSSPASLKYIFFSHCFKKVYVSFPFEFSNSKTLNKNLSRFAFLCSLFHLAAVHGAWNVVRSFLEWLHKCSGKVHSTGIRSERSPTYPEACQALPNPRQG